MIKRSFLPKENSFYFLAKLHRRKRQRVGKGEMFDGDGVFTRPKWHATEGFASEGGREDPT